MRYLVKVTFIIPYDDITDEVHKLLSGVNEEGIAFETTQIIGTYEPKLKEFDSDIVIARGVTFLALKSNLQNVSTIEIVVTGYDVIRAIDECKAKYNPKKIAVIGSESMTLGVDSLEQIMGVEIFIHKVENEENAYEALHRAKEQGVDAIVCGLMTHDLATRMGMKGVWIKTGIEAIKQSINEAINAAHVVRIERAKAALFEIILENTKEGIMAVDKNGRITAFNRSAYKTLNLSKNRKIKGESIKNVFPGSDFLEVLEKNEEEVGVIDNINGTMVVSNRVPIKVDNYRAGTVITFQNVDRIQEIESKIRKELSTKGLVAKYSFGNIVGNSKVINETIQRAYKYSQVDSNILLVGKTGTGKELFAQSIHNASNRRFEPFVAVNCAAVPENLLESELFGYADGAFSGATKGGKIGLFELAHKGTIFLDEIGELSLNLQAKLLRVLQEKEIRKIGGDKVIPIDVRIISATNKDLREKIKQGEFRQDLLYRLDILNLRIPSLRERREDIEHLAKYFIEKYNKKFNGTLLDLRPDAIEALSKYDWPGNIRELRNICERLVVLIEGLTISEGDIEGVLNINSVTEDKRETSSAIKINELHTLSEEIDMETLEKLMQSMRVNKSEVAKIMGISRTTLWRRMKEKS
jgi:transcriptional regulator, propionate catabolism operon regulatory protein